MKCRRKLAALLPPSGSGALLLTSLFGFFLAFKGFLKFVLLLRAPGRVHVATWQPPRAAAGIVCSQAGSVMGPHRHSPAPPCCSAHVCCCARVLKPGGLVVLSDSVQLGDRPAWDKTLWQFGNMNEPHYGWVV